MWFCFTVSIISFIALDTGLLLYIHLCVSFCHLSPLLDYSLLWSETIDCVVHNCISRAWPVSSIQESVWCLLNGKTKSRSMIFTGNLIVCLALVKSVVHNGCFGNTVVGKGRVFVATTVVGKPLPAFRGQGPRTRDNTHGATLQCRELAHISHNFRIAYQTLM